jgi:hypothetical protein
MRNVVTALLAGLGMALLVGGVMAFIGGIFQLQVRVVNYLGPLNGTWDQDQVKFLGAILAPIGSGLLTFALLVRRR